MLTNEKLQLIKSTIKEKHEQDMNDYRDFTMDNVKKGLITLYARGMLLSKHENDDTNYKYSLNANIIDVAKVSDFNDISFLTIYNDNTEAFELVWDIATFNNIIKNNIDHDQFYGELNFKEKNKIKERTMDYKRDSEAWENAANYLNFQVAAIQKILPDYLNEEQINEINAKINQKSANYIYEKICRKRMNKKLYLYIWRILWN